MNVPVDICIWCSLRGSNHAHLMFDRLDGVDLYECKRSDMLSSPVAVRVYDYRCKISSLLDSHKILPCLGVMNDRFYVSIMAARNDDSLKRYCIGQLDI